MNLRKLFSRSLEGESPICESSATKLQQPTMQTANSSVADYMSVPTVARCCSFLADKVAIMGCSYKTLSNGVFTQSNANLNYLLSVEPNSRMTSFDFWRALVINTLIQGESFVIPRYVEGTRVLKDLILCSPNSVTYSEDQDIYHVNDSVNRINDTFLEEDILHFKNHTKTGIKGYGFKHFAVDTVSTNILADSKARNEFKTPDAFIKAKADSSTRLDIKEMNNVADKLQSDFGSSASVIIQPQFTEFELIPAVKSSSGSNVVEVKRLAIQDICRFFNVPPMVAFLDGANNYKETESANALAYDAVFPIITRIEQELNRKLVPTTMRGNAKFEFNTFKLYAVCEPNKKADFFLKALQAGMLTPNEIRAIGNKQGVEGGDSLFVSTNLTTPSALSSKSAQESKE